MAQDPDAIQREIDRTRQELAQTLDAIADKVSPRKHLDRGKAKAKDALEQGRAKAKETGESVRQQVEARRNGTSGGGASSGSGGLQTAADGRGQLYHSSGRELRTDRVAVAGAAFVAVLAYLVRRRRRG
ncbi:MAG: DUF3618 domain-containing protein [Actinomycetota bacterium]|nr:DUF3618 domain-containing protein [Actinomycetota bacterium]